MTDIPSWWLYLSGAFFLFNIVLFGVLIYAILSLVKLVKALQPRVESLEDSVKTLIVKVQDVADRVEEVATSVRDTVQNVGGRARNVVGTAEMVAGAASKQFERLAPLATGVITALKVLKAVQEFRHRRAEPEESKKKSSGIVVYKR